jgi:ubiquinone/menaquinone biosynthesis C-methylase UbiE
MSDIRHAYDAWSEQYDHDLNKTRDLEEQALKELLKGNYFSHCIEFGCGTGKNTAWLSGITAQLTAVDFSEGMLSRAKEKVQLAHIRFLQADINQEWAMETGSADLVTFSLVLEHIEDLNEIFRKASSVLIPGGLVYLGELHPFKQYTGSKARFESENGQRVLQGFTHHVSDYTQSAYRQGFHVEAIAEYFDDDQAGELPRILAILFRKGLHSPDH